MLDLGLLDALVAFKELINGDSVIAVIRPMFMMTSVSVYVLLNGILLHLPSHTREHYPVGLIPILRHLLGHTYQPTLLRRLQP